MGIVTLSDGTTYWVDTDSESTARLVVEHKLRDRHDFRDIASVKIMEGCTCDPKSSTYNSRFPWDGEPLKCASGYSYKWD